SRHGQGKAAMAFVQCATCKNEYDNYDSKCPYCGTPSPALANIKPMLMRLTTIGAVVAVGLMMFGQYAPVEKWIADLTASSSREQNTPAQASPRPQPPTTQARSAEGATDTVGTPNPGAASTLVTDAISANAQVLTSVQAVDLYTSSLTSRLTQSNSSIRVTAAPIEAPKNTFTYTLSDKTKLVLALDSENRKIQSITVIDSNERTFVKRLGDTRAVFFAAALPPKMQGEDINAQLDYLQQLVGVARNNEASYRFQGYQLFARLDNNKRSITIKLTL
ncbi:MAG: hypothetical protein ACRCWR_04290, partial [Saezia sp.]